VSRDAESVLFESQYWQALLADIGEVNGLLSSAARAVSGTTVGLLALIPLVRTDADLAAVERISADQGSAMDSLSAIQTVLIRMSELAAGRAPALYREAGLEPPEAQA
jgi:hypothetical protein